MHTELYQRAVVAVAVAQYSGLTAAVAARIIAAVSSA